MRSTFAKLENLLSDDVHVGEITYLDYETQVIPFDNLMWAYMHKRKSFEHEREVRALVTDLKDAQNPNAATENPAGIWKNLDLNELVEKVIIAPTAPQWFIETVQAVTTRFGFAFPISASSLDAAPTW